MRDPHVVSLEYLLIPDETTSFNSPAAVEHETDTFQLRLADETVQITMKAHFATQQEARDHVEAFLRAWEIKSSLRSHGLVEIRFEFQKAEMIDRKPPPPGTPQTIQAAGIASAAGFGMTAVSHVSRASYPRPPQRFSATHDVQVMWKRYQNYKNGSESVETMAYYSLTVLESRFPG